MISVLRRCVTGCPSRNVMVRVNGVCVDSVMNSTGVSRSLAGTTTTERGAGKAAFELLDEDIDEKFVKGSGPGGQKINKVRNCVQLTHVPTGVSVSCQDSRELHANRHIARKRLKEKVEFQLQGEDSKVGRRINKIRNRKARSQRKARLKHQEAAAATTETDGVGPSAASATKRRIMDARDSLEAMTRKIMAADGGYGSSHDGDGGGGGGDGGGD